jgi:hypothetical protein
VIQNCILVAVLQRIVSFSIVLNVFLFGFSALAQREMQALRMDEKITIDGKLDEAAWAQAEVTKDFIQSSPQVGEPSKGQTEVRVIYDDYAIYVAAVCYDDMSQISRVLSQRDDFNSNTDYFTFLVDTYNDDQNGFAFGVSNMGVQYDGKVFVSDWFGNLDMAWWSAVHLNEDNWTVEMKIPYSAFRFAKKTEQNWGVNFLRQISRYRESSSWNPMRPDFDNDMAQCGNLKSVRDIQPPFRLSLMPYVSAYAEHFPYNIEGKRNWGYSVNGGMDIKYGINEAFTLDMTLIPDFGQVQFDNEILNLTPFEVQFVDYRQFFTEGTELFNKTNLFYSRRIGGRPIAFNQVAGQLDSNEIILENPMNSQLYNATKVSGRTKSGLGIGVFNGLSAATYATVENIETLEKRSVLTAPLSNYNVLVIDQNLKNNSYVTLTNTNVWREGGFYDANLTALHSKFNTKDNAYFVSGNGNLSQRYFSDSVQLGHSWGINLGKQTGKWVYNTRYAEDSDTYNPNDLGFLLNNNTRLAELSTGYNIYKPFWRLNRLWSRLTLTYRRLYAPSRFSSLGLNGNIGVTDKRFHSYNLQFTSNLMESYDFFEPRKWGEFFIRPANIRAGGWISSNYQKRFALDMNLFATYFDRPGWTEWNFRVSPRFRLSDRIFLILDYDQVNTYNEQGYAVRVLPENPYPDKIIFGSRDKLTTVSTVNLNYTLTNRMGITFRLRHYWARVTYRDFFELNASGRLDELAFEGLNASGNSYYNTNYNAFTIDMVYRWVFAPASEINIVWKNAIFNTNSNVELNYFRNVEELFALGALNSLSIRVMYFFDTLNFKKLSKKNRINS